MTKTSTIDTAATVAQIRELEDVGCDIVRVAVPDMEAAAALRSIKAAAKVPLIADVHFDHRLGVEALRQGVDGLRINPGNVGGEPNVREVVAAARERVVPIRIGVNSGSVEKALLGRYGGPTPEAMVESALRHVALLERLGYEEMKISLKASNVPDTIRAYRIMADRVAYPLHLGVTEAGTLLSSAVKSSLGIGILLAEGIGDTIRVSVTGHPTEEVRLGQRILRALGLARGGIEIVSCPTCGRCGIDLVRLVEEVERRCAHLDRTLTVAIMGCVVNGPGEASEADIGVAGGKGSAVLFKRGTVVRKIREEEIASTLMEEIDRWGG